MKKPSIISGIAILFSLAFVSLVGGCDQVNQVVDKGSALLNDSGVINSTGSPVAGGDHNAPGQLPTLAQYFGGRPVYLFTRINGNTIDCKSGDCPPPQDNNNGMVEAENKFADTSEVDADIIKIPSSSAVHITTESGCRTAVDFSWPQELTITEKTPDKLVGQGHNHVRLSASGSCGEYSYTSQTDETWIFTTERLGDSSVVTVTSDAPSTTFSAPGMDETQPASERQWSQYSITVSVSSPYGFNVEPDLLIRANGHTINPMDQPLNFKREIVNATTYRYTFASRYNAEFTVAGLCRTHGGDFEPKVSDQTYTIEVTDGPRGPLPDFYYKDSQ